MNGRRMWMLALTGASLVACSSSNTGAPAPSDAGGDSSIPSGGDDDGSVEDATVPLEGGQTVGSAGGTLTAQGVALTFPAGALPGDTQLAIQNGGPAPSNYAALTPMFVFAPVGTTLLKPATIAFDLANAPSTVHVYWSDGGGAFEPLATTITVSSVSASITRLGDVFVGSPATYVPDAGDAAAGDDASPADDAGSSDAGTDAGSTGTDASSTDAGTEVDAGDASGGGPAEAGADASAGDASAAGISVKVDNVLTTFASNQSVTYVNGLSTITADDTTSPTHWQLQLKVTLTASQTCSTSTTVPLVTYTHFTNGTADSVYGSNQTQGYCTIAITSTAASVGQHATGTFASGVDLAQDAGQGLHLLASGSFDLIR